MSKDPAFLLYSSDFISGVADLTMEERGQYITLLCLQHQKGHLTEKAVKLALGIRTLDEIPDLLQKFAIDESGLFYNKRMDEEIQKRAAVSKARTESAHKSWENRPCKSKAKADANAMQMHKRKGSKAPTSRVEDDIYIPVSLVQRKSNTENVEERGFSPLLQAALEKWLAYKQERKEPYKPTGLEQLLNRAERIAHEHGDMALIAAIEGSMANGYQGIVWPKPSASPQNKFANLDSLQL